MSRRCRASLAALAGHSSVGSLVHGAFCVASSSKRLFRRSRPVCVLLFHSNKSALVALLLRLLRCGIPSEPAKIIAGTFFFNTEPFPLSELRLSGGGDRASCEGLGKLGRQDCTVRCAVLASLELRTATCCGLGSATRQLQ